MNHKEETALRIVVVSHFLAGSPFAHAINTVKTAHAFAQLGHEVTMVCVRDPDKPWTPQELASRYGIDTGLRWLLLRRKWNGKPGWRGAWSRSVLKRALKRCRPDFVFARDFTAPAVTSQMGIPTLLESHGYPEPGAWSSAFDRTVQAIGSPSFRTWLTISPRLAERYREFGAVPEKLLVLPGAVDIGQFSPPETPTPCPYPTPSPRVVYAGHLYDYKGIPTILEAAKKLPNVGFHLVGGWPEDLDRQRASAEALGLKNIKFHGLLPHDELPPYLWHADVLLLPPSAHHPSAAWTSPVKMGEYLASRVPVVASRIPALEHWLDDTQVEYFAPDNAGSMADAIQTVLNDSGRRASLVEAGWKRVQALSYERRAELMLRHAGMAPNDTGGDFERA